MLHSAITRKGSTQSMGKLQGAYARIFYAAAFLHSILVMHCQMEVSHYNYRLRDFLVSRCPMSGHALQCACKLTKLHHLRPHAELCTERHSDCLNHKSCMCVGFKGRAGRMQLPCAGMLTIAAHLQPSAERGRCLPAVQGFDAALRLLLEGQVTIPWPQIQVMMSDITHGSRIPDAKDMHYLHTLVHQLVNENVVLQPKMPLAPNPEYFVPQEGTLAGLKVGHIKTCSWM